ncbi:hypothetical protein [Lunatibacter salilacus]|uniref:hypothetical protein n=1 Tax=Lunatibacter salilacus TaxID=2483804 RepID=UPI00131C224E|nr:hypothetical protein [Lunatibacter salilacus]
MNMLMTFIAAVGISFSSILQPPADKALAEITVIETQDQSFNLTIKEAVGTVWVSIYDEDGKLINRNVVRAKEPVKVPYNLSQLPVGNYTVNVASKVESVSFDVTTKEKVTKKLLAYAYKLDNHTVQVKVVGIEKPGVKVAFFEEDTHRKVSSDYVTEPAGFAKNYKFVKMELAKVYMVVTDFEGRSKVFHF